MRAGVSLAIRAVFAIVLMVLFYALAAAVAAGLVGLGIVILEHVTLIRNGRVMLAVGLAGRRPWVAWDRRRAATRRQDRVRPASIYASSPPERYSHDCGRHGAARLADDRATAKWRTIAV